MGRRTSGGDTLLLWWLHSSQVTFHPWRSEVRPRRCPHSTEAREAGRRRLSPGAHAAQVMTLAQAVDGPWRPGVPGGWPGPLPPALRPHLSRSVFKRCLEGPRTSWLPLVLVIPGTVCPAQDFTPSVLPATAAPSGLPACRQGPACPRQAWGFTRRASARPAARTWDAVSRRGQGLGRGRLVPGPLRRLPQVGTPQNSERGRGA